MFNNLFKKKIDKSRKSFGWFTMTNLIRKLFYMYINKCKWSS